MFQLKQILHSPTRITADSSTLIDVVLCSEHLLPNSSEVLHITLSDHYPVFAKIEFQKCRRPSRTIIRRNYASSNYTNFIKDLLSSRIMNTIFSYTDVPKLKRGSCGRMNFCLSVIIIPHFVSTELRMSINPGFPKEFKS